MNICRALFTRYIALFIVLFIQQPVATYGEECPLIPAPAKISWNNQKFFLDRAFDININIRHNEDLDLIIDSVISSNFVFLTERGDAIEEGERVFNITLIDSLPGVERNSNEAYSLLITSDTVILEAESGTGLYFGLMTLKQLIIKGPRPFIEGCEILDWPSFSIRGFMIDAGRNYIPVEMLKEIIDVMSAYKLNTFHFHLTDNPGWRLESKLYPMLKNSSSMSRWKGLYYSQDDFIELIYYCNKRSITLIPELDIPGHTEAFRKALEIDSMESPLVKPILSNLIDELCKLASPDLMPYIHLGTDEVRRGIEEPAADLLPYLVEKVTLNKREPIVWRPGYNIDGDSVSITQLWSSRGKPRKDHRYLDSRLNYLNHLDPLAGVAQLYFDRIGGKAYGDSLCLGGVLCCWNDNNVTEAYDIIRQNPVYPGILTYSEISWHGQRTFTGEKYLAKFPDPSNELFTSFSEFEDRLIKNRDLYFRDKPFPYVKQTKIKWSLIGAFDNEGDINLDFPIEDTIKTNYLIDSIKYSWLGPVYGGTININHFFGYPSYFTEKTGTIYAFTRIWSPRNQDIDCWIGFHDWSRSGGRRGGPFPDIGQWHTTNPWVKINYVKIDPPVWNNPGLTHHTEEIPFIDENYSLRPPSKVKLKKGWNSVLIKIPKVDRTWKWMFTFVPVKVDNGRVLEMDELVYDNYIN